MASSPPKGKKVSRMIDQARESFRLLEALEKETLAKARTFVRNPIRLTQRSHTHDRIAATLRSLGVVSRVEHERLARNVAALESELRALKADALDGGKSSAPEITPELGSFPNT